QITSLSDGAWENSATWSCNCIPSSADVGPIIVAHAKNVTEDLSIDELVIANGGQLTIDQGITVTVEDDFISTPLLVEAGGQLINNGVIDLTSVFIAGIIVDGVFENSSDIILSDPLFLIFNNGSTYRHNHASGGDIPLASWDPNSTVEITGLGDSNPAPPNNLNQAFGNFTWNTAAMGEPSPSTSFNLGGQLTNIQGDL